MSGPLTIPSVSSPIILAMFQSCKAVIDIHVLHRSFIFGIMQQFCYRCFFPSCCILYKYFYGKNHSQTTLPQCSQRDVRRASLPQHTFGEKHVLRNNFHPGVSSSSQFRIGGYVPGPMDLHKVWETATPSAFTLHFARVLNTCMVVKCHFGEVQPGQMHLIKKGNLLCSFLNLC